MHKRQNFLEPLTPIVLDEEHKKLQSYENYVKAIDEAFTCDDICNIALTGPYGAGKSTIMQTYEEAHLERNYIHISLAKFGDEAKPEEGHFTQRELEIKIINQIIHQVSEKSIPQTKFHTKKEIQDITIWIYTALIFVMLVCFWYLLVVPSSMWNEDSGQTLYQSFMLNGWNIVVLIMEFASIFVLLFCVVKRQMVSPLIKAIQVDKSKIELADESKDTDEHQFNRYMDELIYIFKNGKIDALVLDDIDRFEQLEVFTELREMNYLINKKLQLASTPKKPAKKIKFFYMVKDELFKNFEQRTKFFDLIIPIVPAMNSSNSFELVKELMKKDAVLGAEAEHLDMKYIQMICLNIHDYRVLKNICNEYKMFYKQLRIPELQLSATKLFAMVTYKNLWPEDYAKLQRKEGWVFDRLSEVAEWQLKREEKLSNDIKAIQQEILNIEAERLNDMDDLACIFFKNPSVCQKMGYFSINGKSQWSYDTHKAFIKALQEANSVDWNTEYYGSVRKTSYTKEDIAVWFKDMESNPEYQKRRQAIERRNGEWVKKKEAEIEKIKEEIAQTKMMSLSQVLVQEDCTIEDFIIKSKDNENGKKKEVSEPKIDLTILKLVSNFLKDGVISEDYQSYMTYFYPYSLNLNEIAFLNAVRAGDREKSVDFEITNYKIILDHLREQDYHNKALPNYSLLDFALKNKNDKLVNCIFDVIKADKNIDFVMNFCKKHKEYSLNDILIYWPKFVNDVVQNIDLPWMEKQKILMLALAMDTMHENMLDEWSVEVLLDHEVEIIKDCTLEQLNRFLSMYVLIDEATSSEISEEKRAIIFERRAFTCKEENVNYLLAKNSDRKESVVLEVLNDSTMPYEEKVQLIQNMHGVIIQDISKVQNEENSTGKDVWSFLLEKDKVTYSARNILNVWKQKELFSSELFEFMRNHYVNGKCGLSYNMIKEFMSEVDQGESLAKKFVDQVLLFEDFGRGMLNILNDLNCYYDSFLFDKCSKVNLELIIRNTKIIRMNEEHLLKIRKEWAIEYLIDWIVQQPMLYCNLMKNAKLRVEKELQTLIHDDRIFESVKCILLEYCEDPIMVKDSFNSAVVEKILETDRFGGNYTVLFNRYVAKQRYSQRVKKLIEDYSMRHIKDIIALRNQIPQRILTLAMEDVRITQADKKLLLAKQAHYLQKFTLEWFLLDLEEDNLYAAMQGKQEKIEANEANQVLLDALVAQKWISSYKADKEHYIVYPKRNVEKIAKH